jgi:hypothetical protein
MKRISVLCCTMLLLAACTAFFSTEASAQKKKATTKTEQVGEQTPSAPAQGKLGATLRDVLSKYRGEKTNLGVLSKVEGDYFAVEDDGVVTLHPLSAITGIKILKAEEGEEEPAKIEITLLR